MRNVMLMWLILATTVVMAKEIEGRKIEGRKIIAGYPVGSFSISPLIEKQVIQLVKEIQAKIEEIKIKGELYISVIGSADRSGPSSLNDRLAQDRAEQVANFLAAHFPKAKITAWSKGNIENVRQVRVEYKIIISAPTTVPSKKVLVWVVGVIILLVMISFFKILTSSVKNRWIFVEVEGNLYKVLVKVKNKKFLSPFKSKSGQQIIREHKEEIIESLKGCLKKEEFQDQKAKLIQKGIIKKILQKIE